MYFLNGDRAYIKPVKACTNLNDQVESCITQLAEINSGKKVFKLNFFVDTESDSAYRELQSTVEQRVDALFSDGVISNFIAQPPLTCRIIVEAFYYDPELWQLKNISIDNNKAMLFTSGETEVLIGNVQANIDPSCKVCSDLAFEGLSKLLNTVNFPVSSIVRQWNYLEDILGFDGEEQRYQEFNNVRSVVYGDSFEEGGYPAATGIGMNRGGVIIEFVAQKSSDIITNPVDNPDQISAHNYSEKVLVGEECVLKTTPKFERARYFQYQDKKMVFISGTASIIGEKTVGVGNPVEQTKVTIENIQRLYSDQVLNNISTENLEAKYGHARVYVKNREDFAAIKRTFKLYFGDLPVVYIIADVCRDDLLVEIEGKVILE